MRTKFKIPRIKYWKASNLAKVIILPKKKKPFTTWFYVNEHFLPKFLGAELKNKKWYASDSKQKLFVRNTKLMLSVEWEDKVKKK
jgi:hypothetical protein